MKRITVLTLFVVLAVLSCKMVDQVAPGGSKLFLTAQPQQIAARGISTLTVTGIRGNGSGAPLPDGTVIRFTVNNAGSVSPNPVETRDGQAISYFHAANFSAAVDVTATSGGADSTGAKVTITVGEARAKTVLVSANPQELPIGGGKSQIRAVVTNADGNPLQGIGVQFTTTHGTLNSGGRVLRTNQNGVAIDILNTTVDATVTATTLDGSKGTVDVTISSTNLTCNFTFSPDPPNVGDTVSFNASASTDTTGTIISYRWDFGDTTTGSGVTTTHVYDLEGNYVVNLTVADDHGAIESCSPQQVSVGCPVVTLSSLPDGKVGNVYNATIIPTPDGNYTFAITSGSPPPGLTLSSTSGTLSGTPTTAVGSPFSFVVTATPLTGGCVATQSYDIIINP